MTISKNGTRIQIHLFSYTLFSQFSLRMKVLLYRMNILCYTTSFIYIFVLYTFYYRLKHFYILQQLYQLLFGKMKSRKTGKSFTTTKKTGEHEEQLLAIKLLYSVNSQPSNERQQILRTINDTIDAAVKRVISSVEKILFKKKLFEGSVSLLNDMATLVSLIKQRTNDLVLNSYFLDFYQMGIEEIDDSMTIAFYNSLVEKIHRESKSSSKGSKKMTIQQPSVKSQLIEKTESPRKQPSISHASFERIPQVIDLSNEAEYPTSQQEHNVRNQRPASNKIQRSQNAYPIEPQRELSERSKNLIRLISGDTASVSTKNAQLIRQVKISCLLPGEPTQYWKYIDKLEGGVVKVIFTS